MLPVMIVSGVLPLLADGPPSARPLPRISAPTSPADLRRQVHQNISGSARDGLAKMKAILADLESRNDGIDWSENIAFCKKEIKFWEQQIADDKALLGGRP